MQSSSKSFRPGLAAILGLLCLITFESSAQQVKSAQSGYVTTNGLKVYYEVYGEGTPIVLLHGAFMTISGNWGELIPQLSKTRKVIAIEMQGHGHTPYSERKPDFATLAGDVNAVMNQLKVDSADIAGYSLGGSIAYEFAIQYPKRVRKLVIISSTWKSSGWRPEIANAFKMMTPEIFANSPMKTAYDAVAPDKTNWTKFVDQMLTFARTPFDLGESNIAKIAAPVLIIAGDNDGLDKTELGKTYQLLGGGISADMAPMPKSHLAVVPAQSHVGLMMQTKIIDGYLEDFLK